MALGERERRQENSAGPAGGSADGATGGGDLQRLWREGQGFASAGQDAINRALSRDSGKFLHATRQTGGQ